MKKIITLLLLLLTTPAFAYTGTFDTLSMSSGSSTTFYNDTYIDALAPSSTKGGLGLSVQTSARESTLDDVSLLNFDVSAIPITSTILSASVELTASAAANASNLGLYKAIRGDWNENQATWTNYKTATAWSTAGARNPTLDIFGTWTTGADALSVVSLTPGRLIGSKVTFPSTTQLTNHVKNNLGGFVNLAIHAYNDQNNVQTFYDTENGILANRPRLVVTYTTPVPTGNYKTYYTRTGGGTPTQCTGLVDADYSGTGTAQPCAWNHPHWAMGMMGAQAHRLLAGDTLIIGNNTFWGCVPDALDTMGTVGDCRDAKYNTNYGTNCYISYTSECKTDAVASGTDSAHKTKIYGKGWDTGCSTKIKLTADRYLHYFLNLNGSSNVDLRCLEFTDSSNAANINRSIQASASANVNIQDVYIHGGATGIFVGGINDWDLTNVDIYANHNAGWDGDIGHTGNVSYNSGTLNFNNVDITYNGCYENTATGLPIDCCSQSQGCYGDGLGTYATGGTWNFNDCNFSHNTSDGLDLLYHTGVAGSSINVKNSKFEGNAGQQVKLAALNDTIENSIIIGNCGYFQGQTFTRTTGGNFDNCRANGDAVALILRTGSQHKLLNSTFTQDGSIMFLTSGSTCNGTEKILARNNIYIGGPKFAYNPEDSTLFWPGGSDGNGSGSCGSSFPSQFDNNYGIEYDMKYNCTNTATYQCNVDPKIAYGSTLGFYTGAAMDVHLLSGSTARDKSDETITCIGDCSKDYNYYARGASWDLGALEYGSTTTGGGGDPDPPNCDDSCSLCYSSTACAASTLAGGCFWHTITSTCETAAEATDCNTTCSLCDGNEVLCKSSSKPCYWNAVDDTCGSVAPVCGNAPNCELCTVQGNSAQTDINCTPFAIPAQGGNGTCHIFRAYGQTICSNTAQGNYGSNCGTDCNICGSESECLAASSTRVSDSGLGVITTPHVCNYWDNKTCNSKDGKFRMGGSQ